MVGDRDAAGDAEIDGVRRLQRAVDLLAGEPARLHFELASYLAALVTNHMHTGRFKRSV